MLQIAFRDLSKLSGDKHYHQKCRDLDLSLIKPVQREQHQQLEALPPPTLTHICVPLIKVGRCILWIKNFKHLSTPPVSLLFLIKMIEGLENVWSPNQFAFKIQFCTCKTLILELFASPAMQGRKLISTSCWRNCCWFSSLHFWLTKLNLWIILINEFNLKNNTYIFQLLCKGLKLIKHLKTSP